ncbi:MAG: DegV family EDD domain-containing protein [Micromonosporaceae bacterium]|nr:DegV family EDD domain-containing protein [Micromonosporaceae bacterium]
MGPEHHSRVAIVTDSTAALPPRVVAHYGIKVVPLQLHIGDRHTDEAHADPDEVARALHGDTPVTTSEPPSPEFFWTYSDAAYTGYREIVSLHISSRLSQTSHSAREAASRMRIPVHVVDSLTSGMSLGFLAVLATEAAMAGWSAAQIVRLLEERKAHGSQMIYVDTLEHLRRGGRIGKAAALLGSALSIKPLLELAEGEIVPLARVSGTQRALARLVDVGVKLSDNRPVDAAVEYVDEPRRAEEVARQMRARVPHLRRLVVTRASAVIAAHLGPGAVGLAVSPCGPGR